MAPTLSTLGFSSSCSAAGSSANGASVRLARAGLPAAFRALTLPAALVVSAVLAAPAAAQWASIPYDPLKQISVGNWFVAHQTPSGHQAFSAIAQTWTTVAPLSSTLVGYGDANMIFNDGGGELRGWSAFTNNSATQTFSASFSLQTGTGTGNSFVIYNDLVPFSKGVLRAHSAYTNTWASVPLSALQANSIAAGLNVAVQKDGLHYHAYTPYTGKWVTLDVPVEGGIPFAGPDYVAVDLRGTSGPFQYAAFSALRGTWNLSPTYPASGAGKISMANANTLAIKIETGVPGTFRYAGYSPITGQWATSALVHSTSSTQSSTAFKNALRVQDSDPAARFELFGAGNGIWQSLTGSNLTEDSLHDDFHVVKDSVGSSTTLYTASALVGGGYKSLVVPMFSPGVSQGSRSCMITGGANLSTFQAWGYSALTHTYAGPVPQPAGSGVSTAAAGSVQGFNVQGAAATGTSARAFSARHGLWAAGPAISPFESWSTLAPIGAGSLLVTYRDNFGSYDLNVFDEHRGTWLPSLALPTGSFAVGQNAILIRNNPTGTYSAYSSQRGTWSTQSGIGTITSGGGQANLNENLLWFTDSNGKLWVYGMPDRAQSWFQYPLAPQYAASGATPGGDTPYFALAVRGTPATELALVYASLGLAPAPLSIGGFTGLLDLDLSAFSLANLGVFDADGVRETKIPLANPIAPSTQAWMQAITVDLVTLQAGFAGRATGVRFF